MIRLVLATENKDKAEEIRAILSEAFLISTPNASRSIALKAPNRSESIGAAPPVVSILTLSDFPGVKLPPEDGESYGENAAVKARTAAKATGEIALGDDTGLEVDYLGGAPGLHSARYAGEGAGYADNRKKLLGAMAGVEPEKRSARFRCTVAIARPEGTVKIAEGVCPGRITEREAGAGGFGYDPIFFVPECGKTFAELSPAEKHRVSHRGRAIRAAVEILKKELRIGS